MLVMCLISLFFSAALSFVSETPQHAVSWTEPDMMKRLGKMFTTEDVQALWGSVSQSNSAYVCSGGKGGSASVASRGGRIGSKKTAAAEFYGKTNNTGQVMMSQADVSSHKGGIKTGRQQIANKRGNRKGMLSE